ncbi:MAG: four helix bundle protein [Patescibacteria group bacterium]|nr:four helix bundle protein [Patescibacteria group bacterium]MDD5164810.1 four helix bundle protein [Patescibacteria group bacterium]MDD5534441.1 four helix bundle protein [Patescibacteria group bacterium]
MEERTIIKSFTDLMVWQESHKLILLIYKITKKFPKEELFGLTNQMRRAGVSITSNIAEGFSRQSFKEKLQFYYMALGSLTEVQNQFLIAKDLKYLDQIEFREAIGQITSVHKLLNAFIKKSKLILSSNPNSKFQIPNSSNKGFTLIELLISLSILVVVILSAVGIYINIIGTRSKSLGQLNLQEDGQYIMSLIVKDIRANKIDYDEYGDSDEKDCGIINVSTLKVGDNTSSRVAKLCLLDFSATPNKIRYKRCLDPNNANRGVLKICRGVDCTTNDCPSTGDTYQTITMANLGVERLDFYINPFTNPFTAGSITYIHPRVTIILKLKSLIEKPGEKQIILEQTVPQRYELKK